MRRTYDGLADRVVLGVCAAAILVMVGWFGGAGEAEARESAPRQVEEVHHVANRGW